MTAPEANVNKCTTCGLCLSSCPTFWLTRAEELSPRGRIAAVQLLSTGQAQCDDVLADSLRSCMGCRMCLPVCPTGVDVPSAVAQAWLSLPSRPPVTDPAHLPGLESQLRDAISRRAKEVLTGHLGGVIAADTAVVVADPVSSLLLPGLAGATGEILAQLGFARNPVLDEVSGLASGIALNLGENAVEATARRLLSDLTVRRSQKVTFVLLDRDATGFWSVPLGDQCTVVTLTELAAAHDLLPKSGLPELREATSAQDRWLGQLPGPAEYLPSRLTALLTPVSEHPAARGPWTEARDKRAAWAVGRPTLTASARALAGTTIQHVSVTIAGTGR